jgi:hypothetical protein
MFFVLSKVFGALTWPSDLLVGLGFAGALLVTTRWARLGLQFLGFDHRAACGWGPLATRQCLDAAARKPISALDCGPRRAGRHRRARRCVRHHGGFSSLAARLFEALGVSASWLMLEDRSRDTGENATFSRALANPKPNETWLCPCSPRPSWHTSRKLKLPSNVTLLPLPAAFSGELWEFLRGNYPSATVFNAYTDVASEMPGAQKAKLAG